MAPRSCLALPSREQVGEVRHRRPAALVEQAAFRGLRLETAVRRSPAVVLSRRATVGIEASGNAVDTRSQTAQNRRTQVATPAAGRRHAGEQRTEAGAVERLPPETGPIEQQPDREQRDQPDRQAEQVAAARAAMFGRDAAAAASGSRRHRERRTKSLSSSRGNGHGLAQGRLQRAQVGERLRRPRRTCAGPAPGRRSSGTCEPASNLFLPVAATKTSSGPT